MRTLLIASLTLLSLAGGTGCVAGPSSGDAGPADAGPLESACRTIAIGDLQLDVQWDYETTYSAPLETELGSAALDHLVFNFVTSAWGWDTVRAITNATGRAPSPLTSGSFRR